jgi:hypothetical protein
MIELLASVTDKKRVLKAGDNWQALKFVITTVITKPNFLLNLTF